jgi:hypothetical protein
VQLSVEAISFQVGDVRPYLLLELTFKKLGVLSASSAGDELIDVDHDEPRPRPLSPCQGAGEGHG